MGEAVAPPRSPATRPLVLLRAHQDIPKTREILAELDGSPCFDLVLSFDVTHSQPAAFPRRLLHDAASFAPLGLRTDAPQLLWRCGDLPLYLARQAFPAHDPLIQLDYDIAFPRGARDGLEQVLQAWAEHPARPGMIGSWLGTRWEGWAWHADARRAFPEVLGCMLAFIGLRAAAVDACLAARRREQQAPGYDPARAMNAEALMPSAVRAAGLGTLCLSELLPGSIGAESFYPSEPDQRVPNFLAREAAARFPDRLMVHPALDEAEHAARLEGARRLRGG
jgi:hypothetical protein